jgi:heme exporter protein A
VIASVSVEGLAIARGGRALFRDLAFEATAGEAVALVGANGAGKTSLLRALAGFLQPQAGEVRFRNAAGELLEPEDARDGLHWLGWQDGFKPTRTLKDEIVFQSAWCGRTREEGLTAAERLGLAPLLDLETRRLSAGQRRRAALVRLLASPRPVWLLDEPLAPLDAERRHALGVLMADHLAAGGLIVAAVHDPLPVPARMVRVGEGA